MGDITAVFIPLRALRGPKYLACRVVEVLKGVYGGATSTVYICKRCAIVTLHRDRSTKICRKSNNHLGDRYDEKFIF